MNSITAFEAKTRFGELLDRVANGEEIVITRHDKPVARVVPENRSSLVEVQEAVDGLRALRKRIRSKPYGKGKLTDQEIRDAIDEGRM